MYRYICVYINQYVPDAATAGIPIPGKTESPHNLRFLIGVWHVGKMSVPVHQEIRVWVCTILL